MQKIEESKQIRQELKSNEEKNETKRKYLLEKNRVIEKTRNENQSKNAEVIDYINIIFKLMTHKF